MSTYWRKREQEHIKKAIKDITSITKKLISNQKRAMTDIQLQIDAFYGQYATAEGITMTEARRRIDKIDIEEYAVKAKGYVKDKDFSGRANEELRLYNVTMQISRLELLKANINLELAAMTSEEQRLLTDAFTAGARAEYERQAGILGTNLNYNARGLESIVNASFLSATWSDRLWDNQDALKKEIDRLLNRGIVQGQNPRKLARELREKFESSIYDSERLLITEMARVQQDVFTDGAYQMEFDSYEYIAEPTACKFCAALDGKIFKFVDAVVGINAYPMHPHCMCSSAYAYDREAWEADLTRRGL